FDRDGNQAQFKQAGPASAATAAGGTGGGGRRVGGQGWCGHSILRVGKQGWGWTSGRLGSVVDEVTAGGLLEAGLAAFGFDLALQSGIKSGCGGLTRGGGPVAFSGHGSNHL